jgi:hypothetical protein
MPNGDNPADRRFREDVASRLGRLEEALQNSREERGRLFQSVSEMKKLLGDMAMLQQAHSLDMKAQHTALSEKIDTLNQTVHEEIKPGVDDWKKTKTRGVAYIIGAVGTGAAGGCGFDAAVGWLGSIIKGG